MSGRERIKSSEIKEILNETNNDEENVNEHKRKQSTNIGMDDSPNLQSTPMKYVYYKVDENGEEQTMDSMSLSLFQHNRSLKSKVIKEILAPTYVSEIKDTIHERKICKITADVFLTLSKLATLMSTIFAFAASTYNHRYLSFTAGIIGCIAGAFLQFYHFAKGESNNKTIYENNLLANLGINNFIIDVDKSNDFDVDINEHDKQNNVVKKKTKNKKSENNVIFKNNKDDVEQKDENV